MKRIILPLLIFGIYTISFSQQQDTATLSVADKMLLSDNKILIGGYGQIDYNQALDKDVRNNGTLDVHRMVMLFGYGFTPKTKFITELEFEHVKEVYVEQAFLQHRLHKYINLRAGLMLIPMGLINEYHEPTAFRGVERPIIDNKISPTTWREVGFGLTGQIPSAALKYQAYLVNGFNGYNSKGTFSGSSGFRSGRQKGAESYISAPNFTGKVDYYGIRNLNIGIAGYAGKSQSALYHGLDKSNAQAITRADSSVVGIAMTGLDARYNLKGFEGKAQLYYVSISNTLQYNTFSKTDLGASLLGYYIECGYDILHHKKNVPDMLIPFVRLEKYDTHASVTSETTQNSAYNKTVITAGIDWKMDKGAVLKVDTQMITTASGKKTTTINAGVGVMF